MIKNTFVYLLGLPGAGKLTVARELQKNFDSILIDNHYVNNVVLGLVDPDGVTKLPARVWDYTKEVRKIVLNVIRELAKPDRNFVFTNALAEGDSVDERLFEEIADLAKARGANLLPVRLLVSKEELCRRVVSLERKEQLKSIDPEGASEVWEKYSVINPSGAFDLEASTLSPEESARAILNELSSRFGT